MLKLFKKFAQFIGYSVIFLVAIVVIGGAVAWVMLRESRETTARDAGRSIAVVDLKGEVMSSHEFRRQLRRQVENEKVQGIVVRVESPGGMVGAAEEVYRAIKSAATIKPVVCSLGSLAASGGLYAAVGCNKIVTNRGTLTGSIGVIMMMPNFSGVMRSTGIDMTVIKSGSLKDSGSPFRELTSDDRAALQAIVNRAHQQFVEVISEARGLEMGHVEAFSNGRIILGEEAVELGLADELGDVEHSAKLALELANIEGEPEIIFPRDRPSFLRFLSDIADSRLAAYLTRFEGPQLRYQMY